MEPRKFETPVQSRGDAQTAPARQPDRKRRFEILRLEERVAPCKGMGGHGHGCTKVCIG